MRRTRLAIILTALLVLTNIAAPAYAYVDPGDLGGSAGGDSGGDVSAGDSTTPRLKDIVTPVIRVINVTLLAGGIVFIIMLFWAGYRFSLAQGDPKSIVLAKESLTHAIQGFIIVIGAFALVNMISGLFGIANIGDNLGGGSESAIQELQDLFDSSGQL